MNIIIDYSKCMSIKKKNNTNVQCIYKKKCGDYCSRHSKVKNVNRIDANKFNLSNNELEIVKKIQKKVRNKYLASISGPAYNNITLADNDIDIISLERLWTIKNDNKKNDNTTTSQKKIYDCEFDKKFIFSYKDNNIIRCYNIRSLENLINSGSIKDPFTNKDFDEVVLTNIKKKIKFINKIEPPIKHEKKKIIDKVFDILDKYQLYDFYIQNDWLTQLNNMQMTKFYDETKMIWNNLLNDNLSLSKKIIPNSTNLFNKTHIEVRKYKQIKLLELVIDIMDIFISSGINESFCKYGAYIIIGSLTTVSYKIKSAFPHIFTY